MNDIKLCILDLVKAEITGELKTEFDAEFCMLVEIAYKDLIEQILSNLKVD